MKKAIYKFLIAIVVFTMACADLDEKPIGVLAPSSVFNTPKDVEIAVLGSLGLLATEELFGRQFNVALMLRSDMVDIGDRGTPAARQQMNDFNMDDSNGMIAVFWPRWYQVISGANAAIDGASRINATEAELNPIVAEARFYRAFSYYHLVRNFGDIPYIDFFITDPVSVAKISKTPASEVYAKILEDLEFAKQHLPEKYPANVRTRATKGTAAAYLANYWLTLGNYEKAYAEAKWVIDNKERFGYGLVEDFQDLFNATKANGLKEHIFAIDYMGLKTGGGNANVDYVASMTGVRGADRQGWSVAVPSMEVYNTWDSRDYRKKVSFADSIIMKGVLQPYTMFANTKRPHIAKFFRFAGNAEGEYQNSDHNYADFRYAEVLLIAAEALAEINNGPNNEAIEYVNQIRERARNWAGIQTDFPANVQTGLNKTDFIELILEERRLELAFEWKRWYDIQRRKLGEKVFKGPNSLEPRSTFDPQRDYLMPIPRSELDKNPNLRPQNSGY
jgi:starch-binding outer membrane protein, SusD/RagB family